MVLDCFVVDLVQYTCIELERFLDFVHGIKSIKCSIAAILVLESIAACTACKKEGLYEASSVFDGGSGSHRHGGGCHWQLESNRRGAQWIPGANVCLQSGRQ